MLLLSSANSIGWHLSRCVVDGCLSIDPFSNVLFGQQSASASVNAVFTTMAVNVNSLHSQYSAVDNSCIAVDTSHDLLWPAMAVDEHGRSKAIEEAMSTD